MEKAQLAEVKKTLNVPGEYGIERLCLALESTSEYFYLQGQ
jgi:hypothetical protein